MRNRKRKVISTINVTPLVDVMLVLLVIFMITSPMLVSGMNVDLPKTKAMPMHGSDEPLSVSVDKNGSLFLNTTHIKESELVAKLKAITGEKYDTRILVKGDRKVDYGAVMKAIGLISSAGFTKVSLVTEVE